MSQTSFPACATIISGGHLSHSQHILCPEHSLTRSCGHEQQRAGQEWLKSLIYPAPNAGLVQQGQAALGLSPSPPCAAEAREGLHRLSHCSKNSGEQGQKAP